ncbi:MAG: glycoside hydrolase family 3 protein [Candidatus Sumerlaeaceae bacterium]|nr:glycoside hydrolase family 3 protein [Candidatus Sumerlaeaceae bacterium]
MFRSLSAYMDAAAAVAEGLTLREKVGRVFLFTLRNLPNAENLLALEPAGFIRLYSDALTASRQHKCLRDRAPYPLLIAADFEKGVAPVLAAATEFAPAMGLAATQDPTLTESVAVAIATEAAAVGVNWNLMPTLDVNTDPENPIINVRAFSDDPKIVTAHGLAFLRGLRKGGVAACAKHFPGHGPTHSDSHLTLPEVRIDKRQLITYHLAPFQAAIEEGIEAVMVGHLSCPALDPSGVPATFSSRIIEGFLRGDCGFQGVVVSDALDMGALTRSFSHEEIAVRALLAGCDLLIMPAFPYQAYQAVYAAVQDGTIPKARLESAVRRVIALACWAHDLSAQELFDSTGNMDKICCDNHQDLAEEVAQRSLTLISDNASHIPLTNDNVAVVSFSTTQDGLFEYLSPKSFGDYCARFSSRISSFYCGFLGEQRYDIENQEEYVLQLCRQADVIVVGIFARLVVAGNKKGLEERARSLLERIAALGKPVIISLFGSPYLVPHLRRYAETILCAYGGGPAQQKAAALTLFGQNMCTGSLPIRIV